MFPLIFIVYYIFSGLLKHELDMLTWISEQSEHTTNKKYLILSGDLFFVVLACHQLVLDGSINVLKLFHTLRSAVD